MGAIEAEETMKQLLWDLCKETVEILAYTLLGLLAVGQIIVDFWAYQQVITMIGR